MRTSFRRAVAAATVTVVVSSALVLGAATPAAALDSTACPHASSTRLLTVDDGAIKLWLHQPDGGTAYVCFGFGTTARGVLVFEAGLGGSLVPTVTPDVDASDCATFLHVQDPADVEVQLELHPFLRPFRTYFCFGVNGTAVGVLVTGANGSVDPNVELWLDPFTTLCATYSGSTCTTARRIDIV